MSEWISVKDRLPNHNQEILATDGAIEMSEHDNVNNPKHYCSSDAKCSACGNPIECIDVTRHQSFAIGNAIKYLWRYKHKNGVEDLRKSIWYINDEIKKYEE